MSPFFQGWGILKGQDSLHAKTLGRNAPGVFHLTPTPTRCYEAQVPQLFWNVSRET